jgi:hypothetical protein
MLRHPRLIVRWAWLPTALAALGCARPVDAQPAAPVSKSTAATRTGASNASPAKKWVRLLKGKTREPLAMQTAIVRYVPASDFDADSAPADYPRYVDLVGAVHIGDHDYYKNLNRRFRDYDAVLYELVAPEGTVVPRGRGADSSHPLGALQNGMKNMLEVEHQLEQIDYTRPNFVHADMSPEEFMKSMDDRQEGFVQMYFKVLGASLAHQSQAEADGASADADIFVALFANDRARRLKIAMAKQFEGMEELLVGLAGPDGSTLITERNKRALDVLQKELDGGEQRLAIFYGAGHLSDMQEQMMKRFDVKPVSIEWLDAWDLRAE